MRSIWDHHHYYMAQATSADIIVMPANASGWNDGGIYQDMHLHSWNSESPQVENMWNTFYQGVLTANQVIAKIEKDILPVPSEVGKEAALSELKVARAFFYWLILDNYGDAPLVTTVTEAGQELPAKTPRSEIYQFVIEEITRALPHLSENNNTLMYGRFNKWAAKALMANIYLNAQVYTGKAQWQKCLVQINDIINANKYTLEPDYRDIFKTNNMGSSEIIFAIPFDENVGGGFYPQMFSWHGALREKYNMLATPWGAGSAKGVTQFINTYDENDTRLEDTWLMGPQFASDGSPLTGSYDQAGEPLVFTKELPNGLYTGEAEGYRMNKFKVKNGAKVDLDNDFPFFRYAGVLMMKAEVLLRTGQENKAAAIVTRVRARAFAETNPSKATVTGNELLQNSSYNYGYVEDYKIVNEGNTVPIKYGRFLDELGWEFAWEGHRRRNLIRFGVYTTKSWLSHQPNGDYRTVFPIPQTAINTNPNLEQNPDY